MCNRCAWLKLAILLSFPLANYGQANHYNFSTIDVEKGLSNNQVFTIFRDSVGFVWFGTSSGLNRFDGLSCKVYVNIPGDSNSLPDNYISEIFALPGSKLWIGSKSGLSVYDQLTDKFDHNYAAYLRALGLPVARILYSIKDRKGNYWFLFEKEGLYCYKRSVGTSVKVAASALPAAAVTHFCEDRDGNIWTVYNNGMVMNLDAGSLARKKLSALFSNLANTRSPDLRLLADRKQQLWIYDRTLPLGVFKLDVSNNTLVHFSATEPRYTLNDNLIKGIQQDENGDIWIGTDHGGVNVVNENNNSNIIYLVNNENNKNSLSYNSVEVTYKDTRGLIWIGTGKKGVSYINQHVTQFALYRHETGNPNSLLYSDVNCFKEDKKGNVWIGTNGGGLLYFNRHTEQFSVYKNLPSDPGSISGNIIVSLLVDHEGKLWVGTYLNGLNVFDGKKFRHFFNEPGNPSSVSNNSIWSLLEDKQHTIWIGTLQGGLNRYNSATGNFTRFHFGDTRNANYTPTLSEDKQGNIWVGTYEGIKRLNIRRDSVTQIFPGRLSNTLSHENINEIITDKRGLVWVATRNGLNAYNSNTQTFTRFYTGQGLPDNTIQTIVEDKQGNLWVTTNKGLCQLLVTESKAGVSFSVRMYNEANNVQGKVFNQNASMLSSDGLIFKGGSNGFNVIDPARIKAGNSRPELVFTNIDIFNNEIGIGQPADSKVVLRNALPFASSITLGHNENIFSIEFTALDFSQNNQYAYMLEGFNRNWMYTATSKPKVTYTNIDPGNYRFKIRATNSDGVWSDNEKTLNITIEPIFWKTTPAIVLYFIVLAALLYFGRYYTLERARMRFEVITQRNESERIKALDAVKTKFFTNVSHEFRTPLSLIISPLDRILKNTKDSDERKQLLIVRRNAGRLLNLVNQLLDFRKMEVQEFKLQPTEGDVIGFTEDICDSFSDMSEMKNISLSFKTDTDSFIAFFDKDKLEKILFNLLSNAFKYTPAKGIIELSVSVCKQAFNQVKIVVSDTGIGIPADKQGQIFERFFQNDVPANITNPGTGIGLAITREFVKLHNGTITVASEPDRGTAFTVILPMQKAMVTDTVHAGINEEIASHNAGGGEFDMEQAGAQKKSRSRPVILLVEDNDDFRFYLKDNLKHAYEVAETCNGQEAWDKMDVVKPDLVVSDLMMPLMDGIELVRRIRKKPSLATIPFILLTSGGDEELQLESYRLGVSDYMTKPFNYEILASRIKNLLLTSKLASKKQPPVIEVNPAPIEIPAADEQFITSVLAAVEKNMSNPEYTVEELSRDIFMHRAGMYRKLLAITGTSPLEFIRDIRLKRGRQLLEKSGMTIAEVAYEVGFYNPKKFSQHFKEKYGITPSQFHKQQVK